MDKGHCGSTLDDEGNVVVGFRFAASAFGRTLGVVVLPVWSNAVDDESRLTFLGGGTVIGGIPRGLPDMALPGMHDLKPFELLPIALLIALLGFMQTISCAKALASKTGQHLDADRELIGQGLANIAGSLTQSYAVSGSLSRSVLNLNAGAKTGLANVFSSMMVVITLLFLTPLL